MIRKSGSRFSEKIMLKQRDETMIRFNLIGSWSRLIRKSGNRLPDHALGLYARMRVCRYVAVYLTSEAIIPLPLVVVVSILRGRGHHLDLRHHAPVLMLEDVAVEYEFAQLGEWNVDDHWRRGTLAVVPLIDRAVTVLVRRDSRDIGLHDRQRLRDLHERRTGRVLEA